MPADRRGRIGKEPEKDLAANGADRDRGETQNQYPAHLQGDEVDHGEAIVSWTSPVNPRRMAAGDGQEAGDREIIRKRQADEGRTMSIKAKTLRQQSTEEILRWVAESTAAVTGENCFESLTQSLATALGLRYCVLTECLDSPPTRLTTLAFWNGGSFAAAFEYDLAGTPCEKVVAGEACVYHRGVQALYPDDRDLADLEAESYAAVPLQDSEGRVIGHLAVLDVDAIAEDSLDVSILKIFAARAGAELERQRVITELRDQRRLLERQVKDRTLELEAFAYTVSHQLRSPLVTVGGFATLMVSDYEDVLDAKGRGYLSRIGEAAERMGELIDQMLTFTRLRHAGVERQPENVTDVVAEVVEQLAAEIADAGAAVLVQNRGETALTVLANRATMVQALANLVSNALKFVADDRPPEVCIDSEETAGGVRIQVRDDGIGIAAEDHARVFQAFERTEEAHGLRGTGLGLAIVKKAVERMGGSVGLESTPGVGSTFWIELEKA